jgi:uncharacterized protein (TIGR03435 family)
VLRAYDLKNYALNAPDWLAARNFDINAKVHTATKDLQAYALLPAKGGLKLKPVHDNGVFGVDVSHFPDKTRVACRHCTMDKLASILADHVNLAVVDQSGIPQEFSFTLEWSPDQNADNAGPSVFTALKEQLGVQLESRRVPVSILIVDNISQTPTGN